MGSILGFCWRHDLKRANSASGCNSRLPTMSPRAALYMVDTPSSLRSRIDASTPNLSVRASQSYSARPLACGSNTQSCTGWASSPLTRCRSNKDDVRVAVSAIPPLQSCRRSSSASFGHLDSLNRARVLPLPAASASASPAAAADEDMEGSYTSSSGLTVIVRRIRTVDEFRQVATLRADAYYAENQSRFVASLKKKFVEQEVESLQQRTTILSRQGKPYSETLVAVNPSSGAVMACIDMRLHAALNGVHPHGVPQDDPTGCYLLNVVVREDARGQGMGRGIMKAAMSRVVHLWGAGRLYTHVEADNEVAYRLYNSCGFEKHSVESKYEAASKLGQTVLLCASAAAAPPL